MFRSYVDLTANPLITNPMKPGRFLFFFLFLIGSLVSFGQDVSNKGTDFWLGYGYHVSMASNSATGGAQDMVLYFTSDKNANVRIDIPGLSVPYSRTYSVIANQVTISDPIPKSGQQDARIKDVGLTDRGIHVTSDVPVVAYAHIYDNSVSGASLLFPTNALGKDYYSVNYKQVSNSANSNSFFFVVATEDNTSVEITPSATTVNGLPVGQPTIISMNKGQVYNVMGTLTGLFGTDLTGSRIRSISTNGSTGCKKIAVFSGSGKISIGGTSPSTSDNLFVQAFPAVAWGKKYLTVPTGSQPNNFYRVCVTDPKTIVKLNGSVLPPASLVNGFYYEFKNNGSLSNPVAEPNLIESDIPVLVAQYCTTANSEGNSSNNGDPEMIYLSPVEQTINNITLYSASKFKILESYVNVVIKKGGVPSFTLDGVSASANFQTDPKDTAYAYAIIKVTSGASHQLFSDTGFNAIAYGFGSFESYGYNAGTSIRDFSPSAVFKNPYGRIDSAVTCVNTPFQFFVPLNVVPTTLQWDFSAAPNLSPATPIGPVSNVTADTIQNINGITFYYYSPETTFTFSKSNTPALRDTIKLYATTATPDGCGSNAQLLTIPVSVNELPVAQFVSSGPGCVTDSVKLTDQSYMPNGMISRWLWDFGDGTHADLTTPSITPKKYINPAVYSIGLKVVSAIGCISTERFQTVSLTSKPVAGFTISQPDCINTMIKFTDSSTNANGPIAKWIWDLGDGKAVLTNATNTAVSTQYSSDGTKTVSLKVETPSGCQSDAYTSPLLINPQPIPGFRLPEVCLSDASAQFMDTSTIADGSQAQFKWSWNFNAGSPAVSPAPSTLTSTVQNPQVKYNKADYYKVSLTVTSKDGCAATTTEDFTVNGTNPKAAFRMVNPLPFCGTKPVILKDSSTVDFGKVTRLEIYWDNTNQPSVKETDDNPSMGKLYAHSYPDPGQNTAQTYTIRLVAYSGGTACVNSVTQTITVYPQPKAAFTVSAAQLCSGTTVNFQDKSNGVSGAATAWVWSLGGGSTSSLQNPSKQFSDSGLFTTSLYFYNADGCISDTAQQQLTVYPNPVLILPHNATVLSGGVFTIKPGFVYGSQLQYLWTPATYLSSDTALTPVTTPEDDITYRLTLTGVGGCMASDTIFIKVLKGPEVPNAFSPNGDGINDTWRIKNLESYPGASVEVYNRYGQIVFHSTGYSVDWDGTYNGKTLPVGTYYYIINPRNGRSIISGSVTIIK